MQTQITEHAIQRYIQRVARTLAYEQAESELLTALDHATSLKRRSGEGHSLYDVQHPRPCTLVIKPDDQGLAPVLVTVFPPQQVRDTLDELEEYLSDRIQDRDRVRSLLDYADASTRDLLALELSILEKEVTVATIKMRAQKTEIQEKYSGKTTSLRWAVRALLGEITTAEALSRIQDGGAYFLSEEFWGVEFEK